MRVIVSEKPSMGRAIATALGIQGTGRNFIKGKDAIVTWCIGHLVQPVEPDEYNPNLKSWRMDDLPFFPDKFRYAPVKSTKDQFDVVTGLMNNPDVVDIINGCDAGREGQLIFDLVYKLSGCTKPVLRFWTSSLTDKAIQDAYSKMKPNDAYRGLGDAAVSRQEADWLVGINATRMQTLAVRQAGGDGVYSIGRVQTPTLAILVNRELDITNFVPKDFWTLWAVFQAQGGTYEGKWFRTEDGKDQDRFSKEVDVKAIAGKLAGLPGRIASVTAKTEKKKPELLYALTDLQKEANKRFGLTAEKTLEIAQSLYESKLLSYPRTNSRYLTEEGAKKAPEWIKALAHGQLAELQPFIAELRKRWPVQLDKRYVNDKEVEDHEALTPTENPAKNLQGDELKVYDLIARRFLATFFPDRIENKTTIITVIDKETFKTIGTVIKELGWSAVDPTHGKAKKEKAKGKTPDGSDGEAEEDSGLLPEVAKAEAVAVNNLFPKAGKTTPPKRMSEGDLLGSMQVAGRDLDDEELKGAMKACGLGTPATRASTIETILKRGFAERVKNVLQPTDKGIHLIQSIKAEALKSPQMTGEWEARLEQVRRNATGRDEFMTEIRAFVTDLVAQIKQQAPQVVPGSQGMPRSFGATIGACPKCGSDLQLRDWKGKFYVKCSAASNSACMVVYDTDDKGKALKACKFCKEPVRTTKDGGEVCTQCGKWQSAKKARG